LAEDLVEGIRKPLAKKIVGGRPFKPPDELVSKKILSRTVFDKIRHLVHMSRKGSSGRSARPSPHRGAGAPRDPPDLHRPVDRGGWQKPVVARVAIVPASR
jgi:hypothetical protein